jgi:hypothetical protein
LVLAPVMSAICNVFMGAHHMSDARFSFRGDNS